MELLHGGTRANVDTVTDLLVALHAESRYRCQTFVEATVRTEVRARLERLSDLFCIVRHDDRPVALLHGVALHYGIADRWFLRVDYLFVSPGWRGRGVAETLVAFALHRAGLVDAQEAFVVCRGSLRARGFERWLARRFGARPYGGQFAKPV